jgi:hypothetical protein
MHDTCIGHVFCSPTYLQGLRFIRVVSRAGPAAATGMVPVVGSRITPRRLVSATRQNLRPQALPDFSGMFNAPPDYSTQTLLFSCQNA